MKLTLNTKIKKSPNMLSYRSQYTLPTCYVLRFVDLDKTCIGPKVKIPLKICRENFFTAS